MTSKTDPRRLSEVSTRTGRVKAGDVDQWTGHVWTEEEIQEARAWERLRTCQYTPSTCNGCQGSC